MAQMTSSSSLKGRYTTYVHVMYNYTYEYEGRVVSFSKGEELQLLAKSNSDWWHVRRWDKEGLSEDVYVPAVYVKEIQVEKRPNDYENPTETSKDIDSTKGSGAIMHDKPSKKY